MSNNLREIRITDIGRLNGIDWEVTTDINRIGVSYLARRDNSTLSFTDERGLIQTWEFRNGAVITFRGSILIFDTTTGHPRTSET